MHTTCTTLFNRVNMHLYTGNARHMNFICCWCIMSIFLSHQLRLKKKLLCFALFKDINSDEECDSYLISCDVYFPCCKSFGEIYQAVDTLSNTCTPGKKFS